MNTSYGSKTCICLLSLCPEFKPKAQVHDLGLDTRVICGSGFLDLLSRTSVGILGLNSGCYFRILTRIILGYCITFSPFQEFKILPYQIMK